MATTFTGTATAGGGQTLTLSASSPPGTDALIAGQLLTITGGTGVGQCRQIYGYKTATRIATVFPAWAVNPDATSVYSVDSFCFDASVLWVGFLASAAAQTAVLGTGAPTVNGYYGDLMGGTIHIVAGTGAGQGPATIADYVGATKTATIAGTSWATTPDATSIAVVRASLGALQANSITANTMASGSIGGSVFVNGAIGAGIIASNAIVAATFASNAFTAAKFAAACFTSANFDRSTTITAATNGTLSAATATTATSVAITTVAANLYAGMEIYIFSGTGIGQARTILSHTSGTTPVFTIDRPWVTNPVSTSGYQIRPCSNVPLVTLTGTFSAATGTTATSNTVPTVVANQYAGQLLFVPSGTGIGQARTILSHTSGTTPVFTVDRAWATNPVSTDAYQIFPESAFQLATDQAATALIVFTQTASTARGTASSVGEQMIRPSGTVGAGTNGATTFSTSLTTTAGSTQFESQWLCFLSGTLAGQSQQIASNDGSGNITMLTAFTGAPSNGDRFITIGL